MSAIRDKIGVVVAGLAPALKAAGYRKKGFNFRQDVSPGVVRLANVQCSQFNEGIEGSFTVNLGVYHRELQALHDAIPVVESPLVKDCIIQERIGFVMPVGRDFWWSVDNATDLVALGAEVASAWTAYGRRWLESHSSLVEAQRFLVARKEFFLAALASRALGNIGDAELLISRAVEVAPTFRDRLEAWRDAHLASR